MTSSELEAFWARGLYGTPETAATLFARLDVDADDVMTRADWSALFETLDCRPCDAQCQGACVGEVCVRIWDAVGR